MISVIPRKTLIVGFHLSKCGCCRATTFPKILHHGGFFWSLANFFRIDIKNNSWWIAQKILSKWKLSRYYRGGVKRQELQWNCKRKQTEPLRKLYCGHFQDILNQFCLKGVSIDRCQLLWLLRSGKVVGYKVEIPILNPWILREGKALANVGCRGN